MSDEQPDPILQLIDVHKRFGDLVVLDGVDLDIPRGRTTAIIGPSGAGKSVLLKIIVGLLAPDSGQVIFDGRINIATATQRQLYEVRTRCGMLFQEGALFDSMTAGENVAFPLKYHTDWPEARRRERAREVLDVVELGEVFDRPTSALSGGQRKRVGLARAIVLEPEVVLFDEPNSGLDPITSDTIDELIGRMKQQLGITFVVITHDIVSTVDIADHIAMLYEGDLVEHAPTEAFIRSGVPIVRRFLARNVDLPPLPEDGID